METKAKIVKIDSVTPKEFNGKTTYYHKLVMDNDEKLDFGRNKELAVGEEITYTLTGEEYNGYQKAKGVYNSTAGGSKWVKEAYEEKIAGLSLSYAKDFAIAKDLDGKKTLEIADVFYNWLLKKKQ